MDAATRDALEALNRDFYETHAASFSRTRDHPWPGWERVVARLPEGPCRLLDAGCGNGRFARFLASVGRDDVEYTGVDSSHGLLSVARTALAGWPERAVHLVEGDVFDPDAAPGPFDAIVLFGVLHHLAGFGRRVELLARLGQRLAPGGFLAATLWRFGSDPRAAGRTRRCDEHGLEVDPESLEPGDCVLPWREGHEAVRYCHFVDDEEAGRLVERAAEAGLAVADRFRSDGRSGDLNEYLVWTRRDA